jgi:hypothetical protein
MTQMSIFGPVLALVGWTMAVLLLIPYRRFRAAFAGRVKASDFKCGESANVPADVSMPNRVYMNLLEMPVLFYVVCFVAYITQNATPPMITLGWTYLGFRVAHSLVCLTYNHIMHRFAVFALSNVVMLLMWLLLLKGLFFSE